MKLKYYLRGLAVGILVTTVLLMIVGSGKGKTMSDDEVIARAKQLGMVMQDSGTDTKENLFSKKETETTENTENTENTKNTDSTNNSEETKTTDENSNTEKTDADQNAAQPDSTDSNSQPQDAGQNTDAAAQGADAAAPAPEDVQYVEVIVSPGEYCRAVSEDLASKGLVSDSESFRKYMLEIKQDELISSGVYQIPVGASYEDIAKILISGNK